MVYKTIHINAMSDAAQEIEDLKKMLKQNRGYLFQEWTTAAVVEVAINELYDKLGREKANGENQRGAIR